MFEPVASSVKFPQLEATVGEFWKRQNIYQKSLARRADAERFVFYEGPPTANGMPHPGHCLTRAIKDVFPRYRTMRGYLCERKAGWDTHGLPVEVEVCKELGIHSKEEIEAYGVEPFIHKCQESVWRYMQEWERLTERLGFWVNLQEAYVTYHQTYIESVWWALKTLFDRGLLYQGHKIVWWWAQGGTALSSGEVGQGYRQVADPSVYVRFPLVENTRTDEMGLHGAHLLVWTTTPWTLPSNQFVAVHPELEYVVADDMETEHPIIIAAALVDTISEKVGRKLTVMNRLRGHDLVGCRYRPPFDYYHKKDRSTKGKLKNGGAETIAWRVVPAEFVTTDSGTGVVHQAPAFGEVDFDVLVSEQAKFVEGQGPQLICAVGPDGKFTAEAPEYVGRWVKDCDRDISRDLKKRGLMLHQEQYLHDYPFCWRAEEDPLIQYPRKSWFIRTAQSKEQMLANNQHINWLPEHIKAGRFGNFLETNVDWALSRERYWGTPLPIWQCEQTGKYEAIDSYAALLTKPGVQGVDVWDAAKKANPNLSDDLKVHKPYIDAVTYDSPFAAGARMRRVTEVIDCWFDSGAMPFAQWGYPHQGAAKFEEQFPADFISEAIDQTRGWFYSQLAISTLLFSDKHPYPHPFRTCIVLGLMLAEWWESKDGKRLFLSEEDAQAACGAGGFAQKIGKMSKSKRNYREPNEIFDRYGADALRWYFFAQQPPWTTIRYSEQAIKDSIPEFLLRLWNVYSFFVIYARIDGFDPAAEISGNVEQLTAAELSQAKSYRPVAERSELDRWILSELNRTLATVVERMDAYDNYTAAGAITTFVDALSNWYVRRGRDRYWREDKRDPDKLDAYWTLYECLLTTSKMVAPFVPFLADALWQNLATAAFNGKPLESVHLCDFPKTDSRVIDDQLSARMALVREIVSQGRSARTAAKLRVRQPLAKVEVILADRAEQPWLEEHCGLIAEELNVKQVEFTRDAERYISYTVLPDLKRLGPRLGKQLPALKQGLTQVDAAVMLAQMEATGQVELTLGEQSVTLDRDDLQVRLQAKPGWAAAQGKACVVVLATELSDELLAEGWARELVHVIQAQRKDLDCQYTDRVELAIVTVDAAVQAAARQFADYICGETLAKILGSDPIVGVDPIEAKLGDAAVQLYVRIVK